MHVSVLQRESQKSNRKKNFQEKNTGTQRPRLEHIYIIAAIYNIIHHRIYRQIQYNSIL